MEMKVCDVGMCDDLRDYLFNLVPKGFSNSGCDTPFRYLAVVPSTKGNLGLDIHVAFAAPSWERAGYDGGQASVEKVILEALVCYTSDQLHAQVIFHNYLRDGWPMPWGATAKHDVTNFPSLVLFEKADRSVSGVLMRNAHIRPFEAWIANAYCESHEVANLFKSLASLKLHEQFLHTGLYKECDINAESLSEAIEATAQTMAGQKAVMVYRENEWFSGIWNNPSSGSSAGFTLRSVSDFHGGRVSKVKKKTRPALDVVRKNMTVKGNYDHLLAAMRDFNELEPAMSEKLRSARKSMDAFELENFEPIASICNWWNERAPLHCRPAGTFRIYQWSPSERVFTPGDPEEPVIDAENFSKSKCFALFERDGFPTVAIGFYRGRFYNYVNAEGCAQTLSADGSLGWAIGLDLEEVDEAYYSFVGLRSLSASLGDLPNE